VRNYWHSSLSPSFPLLRSHTISISLGGERHHEFYSLGGLHGNIRAVVGTVLVVNNGDANLASRLLEDSAEVGASFVELGLGGVLESKG
jgi:hypothetical protein